MTNKRKSGWMGWVVLVVLLGAAAAGGWWYLKKPKEAPIDYKSAAVEQGDLVQSVTANGQINPVINVQVGSQVSGIIQNLYADFNSRVTNGQVVAQIDPSTFQHILMQTEAEVVNARASLELAQLN